MINPFTYRPLLSEDHPDFMGWEDNYTSNAIAYLSDVLMPKWCNMPHWTVSIVEYLWRDCSCCLAWMFFALGCMFSSTIGIILIFLVYKFCI